MNSSHHHNKTGTASQLGPIHQGNRTMKLTSASINSAIATLLVECEAALATARAMNEAGEHDGPRVRRLARELFALSMRGAEAERQLSLLPSDSAGNSDGSQALGLVNGLYALIAEADLQIWAMELRAEPPKRALTLRESFRRLVGEATLNTMLLLGRHRQLFNVPRAQ
jgi:hypothetical protein